MAGVRACFVSRVKQPYVPGDHKKPRIVCTTNIIADAACAVGGSAVDVVCLMAPGVDPHSYRARERDVHLLAQADLILYHGLHLEGKMGELLAALSKNAPVVAVTRSIALSQLRESSFAGIYDPHVWHDVSLWQQVVQEIADQFSLLDLTKADYFQERCKAYKARLNLLDQYVQNRVATVPVERRVLITAHDAFSYFGSAYGFTVIGLQGISTEVEVGARDIQQLVSYIVDHQISAIFLESSVLPRSLQAVACAVKSRGSVLHVAPELFSDSLGTMHSPASSYCAMITYNIDTIVGALTGASRAKAGAYA